MAGGCANWQCPPATTVLDERLRCRVPASATYAAGIDTHYDVLGVAPDATAAAIRTAYRERARRHHPDRAGGGDDTTTMSTLNDAYRVLSDPGRRALYDRSLRRSSEAVVTDSSDVEGVEYEPPPPNRSVLSPGGPARVPWKLMAVTAVVGSAAVLVGASFNDPPSEEAPDGILRAGSCVTIEPNGDAREIACTNGGDDVVVELLLPTGAECPVGLVAHRDRLGLGTACIAID